MKIRGFVDREDEEVWVWIQNEAYKEYDDFRPDTMEDMEVWKKSPNFDPTGMFIAELDGKPVGAVNAFVDKKRKEKKGFLRGLSVVPEFRKRGVGRRLVERAIESLRERGMETVEGWAREGVRVNPPKNGRIRLVTHHDISADDIEVAGAIAKKVLGS